MAIGRRGKKWLTGAGIFLVAVVLLAVLWDWNWFKPIVEARASATLKRAVTIEDLDVDLSLKPLVTLSGIAVANPEGDFPPDTKMATGQQIAVRIDLPKLLRGTVYLPELSLIGIKARLEDGASGKGNWELSDDDGKQENPPSQSIPEVGQLVVRDADVHFTSKKLNADIAFVANTEQEGGYEPIIVADGQGRYTGDPFKFRFRGGSIMAFRDETQPYPLEVEASVGGTRSTLRGTVSRPAEMGGIKADLLVSGPSLDKLFPIIGIPVPPTPPYELSGRFEYEGTTFTFTGFKGRVGGSDLAGDIKFETGNQRPYLEADLVSNKVRLDDLRGFIGGRPDKDARSGGATAQRPTADGQRPAPNGRRQQNAQASGNAADRPAGERAGTGRSNRNVAGAPPGKVLPHTEINLEMLRAIDGKVQYRGNRIESEYVPVDNLQATLVMENGRLRLEPLSFGVGEGRIVSTIDINGRSNPAQVAADVDFRNVDLRRIMAQTRQFEGLGRIGGRMKLAGQGNSTAAVLGTADGDLKLFMGSGRFSSLLVELIGLDAAEALGFALSRDRQVQIRCMIADFGLQKGVAQARTFVFDTTDTNIVGRGTFNLRDETLNLRLDPAPKDMSILTARAPIDIDGTFADPSVLPDLAVVGARVGAAAVLGVLLTPLAALIPSIELGLGEDSDCRGLIQAAEKSGRMPVKAPPEAKPR